jgi:hypothetical protein
MDAARDIAADALAGKPEVLRGIKAMSMIGPSAVSSRAARRESSNGNRGAFRDPCDERGKARMGAQRLDGVVVARKLRLGHGGVDLVVADLVHENGRPALAAAQARDQVVQALLGVRRDGPVAEGADGVVAHDG